MIHSSSYSSEAILNFWRPKKGGLSQQTLSLISKKKKPWMMEMIENIFLPIQDTKQLNQRFLIIS